MSPVMMMTFLVMMVPPPEDGGKNAFGQVTITKKDDEGRALDGAVFKIDIVFSNGSTGGQGPHMEDAANRHLNYAQFTLG